MLAEVPHIDPVASLKVHNRTTDAITSRKFVGGLCNLLQVVTIADLHKLRAGWRVGYLQNGDLFVSGNDV